MPRLAQGFNLQPDELTHVVEYLTSDNELTLDVSREGLIAAILRRQGNASNDGCYYAIASFDASPDGDDCLIISDDDGDKSFVKDRLTLEDELDEDQTADDVYLIQTIINLTNEGKHG